MLYMVIGKRQFLTANMPLLLAKREKLFLSHLRKIKNEVDFIYYEFDFFMP